jgi:hypothetical protein
MRQSGLLRPGQPVTTVILRSWVLAAEIRSRVVGSSGYSAEAGDNWKFLQGSAAGGGPNRSSLAWGGLAGVTGEGSLASAEHAAASIVRIGNDVNIQLEEHKLCLLELVGVRG